MPSPTLSVIFKFPLLSINTELYDNILLPFKSIVMLLPLSIIIVLIDDGNLLSLINCKVSSFDDSVMAVCKSLYCLFVVKFLIISPCSRYIT